MHWWQRWRRDLARPETPTDRREVFFLVGAALTIVVAAQVTDPGTAAAAAGLLPAVAAFVIRGLFPRVPAEVFALAVIVPVLFVVATGTLEMSMFLPVVMVLYTSWHLGSATRAVAIATAAGAVAIVVDTFMAPAGGMNWAPWASACGFTHLLGRAMYRQQVLIDQLGLARSELAEQAVAEERRRIARELHDLAGHTLAAMVLHVSGARHVLHRDIAEAERALFDAEAVGRASLDQIRSTVVALRTVERGTDPPDPGGSDLVDLVESYRRAGLRIDARIPSRTDQLTAAVGVAVHRITRESLANVARHAPGNAVTVEVGIRGQTVHLLIRDVGRPPAEASMRVGHFGVLGMTERARSLGGTLLAGPSHDGWTVEAVIPHAVSSPVNAIVS